MTPDLLITKFVNTIPLCSTLGPDEHSNIWFPANINGVILTIYPYIEDLKLYYSTSIFGSLFKAKIQYSNTNLNLYYSFKIPNNIALELRSLVIKRAKEISNQKSIEMDNRAKQIFY